MRRIQIFIKEITLAEGTEAIQADVNKFIEDHLHDECDIKWLSTGGRSGVYLTAIIAYECADQGKAALDRPALDCKIENLDISVRALNGLKNLDIQTVGQLIDTSEAAIVKSRHLGAKQLKEIKRALADNGLSLRP